MDVRIDESRKDELAGGIDYFGIGRCCEVFSYAGNSLVFDIDIRKVSRVGSDNFTILDKKRHKAPVKSKDIVASSFDDGFNIA
jgi:hypothetical protein